VIERERGEREESKRESDFQKFWNEVPNKIGKRKGKTAYFKAIENTDPAVIQSGLKQYKAYENSRKEHAGYCPLHPATWLNQERWTDTVVEEKDYECIITVDKKSIQLKAKSKEALNTKKADYIKRNNLKEIMQGMYIRISNE